MGRKEFNRKQLAQLIFLLSGISLIFLAYILELKGFQLSYDVAKDLSVAFLAFVFLDLLWNVFGGESAQTGVTKIFRNVREAEREASWLELIRAANSRIDLQGLSLSYIATDDELMQALKERVIAGVNVRVVIMSPTNLLLSEPLKSLHSFIYPEDIKKSSRIAAERFRRMREELEQVKNKKGTLVFALNNTRPMPISLRRFDDELFVLHYEWNTNTVNAPIYYFRKDAKQSLFERYLHVFEDQFLALLVTEKERGLVDAPSV